MTKRALTIPAVALSILLLSTALAPAAFARGTRTVAHATPAVTNVITLGKSLVGLVNGLLGVASATVAGINTAVNSTIGSASTDPTVVSESAKAEVANELATSYSAQAALANAELFGNGVGTLEANLADALAGS